MELPPPLDAGSDPPVVVGTVSSTRNVFDFEGLPRELRDMVYEFLLNDDDAYPEVTIGRREVTFDRALFFGLACSSKTINAEYHVSARSLKIP